MGQSHKPKITIVFANDSQHEAFVNMLNEWDQTLDALKFSDNVPDETFEDLPQEKPKFHSYDSINGVANNIEFYED